MHRDVLLKRVQHHHTVFHLHLNRIPEFSWFPMIFWDFPTILCDFPWFSTCPKLRHPCPKRPLLPASRPPRSARGSENRSSAAGRNSSPDCCKGQSLTWAKGRSLERLKQAFHGCLGDFFLEIFGSYLDLNAGRFNFLMSYLCFGGDCGGFFMEKIWLDMTS